jgi:hypothetical protein
MTLEEFFQELFRDELSDLFPGNRMNANIESRPKLLPLVNTAMAYAYSKWKVKYASEMLEVVDGTTEYQLAATDILGVIQIVNVYGMDVPQSEYQVLGSKIYFPFPQTQTLEVVYKVKHTKYVEAQDDALVELELPEMLVPWLKAYVCHRYFASMKTEGALAKAADFLVQAQMCENAYMNTNTTQEFTAPVNRKMEARGFA